MSVSLTISGDFCVTTDYVGSNLLNDTIIELFRKQDFNILNLECPVLSDEGKKIIKQGPHLKSNDQIFNHLKSLNINVATLANNHILDYGDAGLQSTVAACSKNNIVTTGVGNNLKDAAKNIILEKNGLRIALVNFCENEWSIAGPNSAGANPLDVVENFYQIKQARADADFVLVIIHGGHEYYNLPSPRMVQQYRFFAEQGADAVIGHHTHCISGMEIHNNIPIFYGLGNMLFTTKSEQPGWHTGLTLQVKLEKNEPLKWQLIPIKQESTSYELGLLQGDEKEKLLNDVEKYSAIIIDDKKLLEAWSDFISSRRAQYLYVFSAMNVIPGRYLKGLLKRMGIIKWLFPQKYLTGIINYINCEAHADVSKEVLSHKLFNK